MESEPKIVGFLCKWCSSKVVDLADSAGFSYPPNVHIVEVPCIGRIDPILILEVLEKGIDGILVAGCQPEECHYGEGNLNARDKLEYAKRMLEKAGIPPERLRIEWISASEVPKFVDTVTEMVNSLREIGSMENKALGAAKAALEDMRLRWLAGKARILTEKGNVYNELLQPEEFDEVMGEAIVAEFTRNRILSLVKDNALSVKEMAKQLGMDPQVVLRHVTNLRSKGLISLDKVEGNSPLYVRT